MSVIGKSPILGEDGVNQRRKRNYSNGDQFNLKSKQDENMGSSEKRTNFSLLNSNANGALKMTSMTITKPGATKKLIIKNFKSE